MTRLLVIVLLALNLLYFGWSSWIDGDVAQLVAGAPVPDATAAATPHAAPVGPPPCAALGPFADGAAALKAKEKLEASGLTVQKRELSEIVHEGWWVHVDNVDADQQTRTLNALKRAGISDAFAMPDDPQFRVSVGIFSAEDRAEDRASRVQKLKLDAAVTERLRDQTVLWYDIAGVAPETLRDGRLAAAGVPIERLRIESCPPAGVAAPPAADAAIIPPP